MNLIWVIDCWRDDDEFSWNNFYFIVVNEFLCSKKILEFVLENLTDNFLIIIVNVNFFGDLKFEYYWVLPWNTATSKP